MLATTPTTRRSRRDAFTLVEVLVVMAIIVILAGIASVGVMRYLDNAKELNAEAQMKNIYSAYMAYNLKSGGDLWPQDPSELVVSPDGGKAYLDGGQQALLSPWGQPYTVQIQEVSSGAKPVVYCQTPGGMTLQYPKPNALQ